MPYTIYSIYLHMYIYISYTIYTYICMSYTIYQIGATIFYIPCIYITHHILPYTILRLLTLGTRGGRDDSNFWGPGFRAFLAVQGLHEESDGGLRALRFPGDLWPEPWGFPKKIGPFLWMSIYGPIHMGSSKIWNVNLYWCL